MSHVVTPSAPPVRPRLRLTHAHVINLAARPERYAHFCRHVQQDLRWPLTLHRFDAIDTRDWTTEESTDLRGSFVPYVTPAALPVIAQNFRTEHRQLSRGAVGCALSHVALWNLLRSHKTWDAMLIFEDDAVWWPAQKIDLAQLEDVIARVPENWDLLTLGCIPREVKQEHPGFLRLNFFHQLHAYIVRKSGVEKLCRDLFPLEEQIDSVVSRKIQQQDLACYAVWPNLFDQMWRRGPGFETDCQTAMVGTPSRHY